MNTLLTSAFVERLGWTLLHSLWQIALIGVALVVCRLIWRSPNARHLIAMLALIASVAWPVLSFVLPTTSPEPTLSISPVESAPPEIQLPTTTPKAAPEVIQVTRSQQIITKAVSLNRRHPSVMSWAVMLWLGGVFMLSLRQAGALVSLHRLRTHGVDEVPPTIRVLFEQTKVRLGVRRFVKIVASARVMAPVVIGSLRPVVLMPASLLSGLPVDQIEALLAHELAHLRRWDDVANLLQCAIETLLFYHPVVWWMSRRAREDRELCCDDLATARGIERSALAQALGRLALWQCEATQPALAATGHMPVLARIRRLLQPAPARVSMNTWPVIVVLAVVLFVTVMSKANAEAPPRGRILDRNGVVLADCHKDGSRYYPMKSLASHVIGYTGLTSAKNSTPYGRDGIEKAMEKELYSKRDVSLTLDAKVQQIVEESLHQRASRGGAAVVVDVTNGDVLALGSWPTYDLNEFVPRLTSEHFEELLKDTHKPLLGRAFLGEYYPASTFKLVTALAALKSGAIDENTRFDSPAEFNIGGRIFHNWSRVNEGEMDLPRAIARTSNTWFYQAGIKTGAQSISDMAMALGFGARTVIPLNEAKGYVPTDAESMARQGTKLLPGMVAQMAIGQVVTVTPLQSTVAVAAIANGGKVLRPRLIKTEDSPEYVTDLLANGLRPEHLELVKQGMMQTVNGDGGTGHLAQVEGMLVAGATGTAQVHVDANGSKSTWLAWFVCYAPADHPKVAISVVYEGAPGEHVSGGSIAAPIASEILTKMKAMPVMTASAVSPPAVKHVKPEPVMLTEQWIKSARCSVFSDMVVLCDGEVDDFDVASSRFEGNVLIIEDGGKTVSGGERARLRHYDDGLSMDNDAITPLKLPAELQPLIDQAANRKPTGATMLTDAWLRSAKVKLLNKSVVFFKGSELSDSSIQGDVLVVVETDGRQHVFGSEHIKVKLDDDGGVKPVEEPITGSHAQMFKTISSELRQLISERVKEATASAQPGGIKEVTALCPEVLEVPWQVDAQRVCTVSDRWTTRVYYHPSVDARNELQAEVPVALVTNTMTKDRVQIHVGHVRVNRGKGPMIVSSDKVIWVARAELPTHWQTALDQSDDHVSGVPWVTTDWMWSAQVEKVKGATIIHQSAKESLQGQMNEGQQRCKGEMIVVGSPGAVVGRDLDVMVIDGKVTVAGRSSRIVWNEVLPKETRDRLGSGAFRSAELAELFDTQKLGKTGSGVERSPWSLRQPWELFDQLMREKDATAKGTEPTSDPGDDYFRAYSFADLAVLEAKAGHTDEALVKLKHSLELLDSVTKRFPKWQPDLVAYRHSRVTNAIGVLEGKETPSMPDQSLCWKALNGLLKEQVERLNARRGSIKVSPKKEASGGVAEEDETSDAAASPFVVSDAASAYYKAYMVNREAEQAATDGKTDIALAKYQEALDLLKAVAGSFPDWQPEMMKFRREKIEKALAELKGKAKPTKVEPQKPDTKGATRGQSSPGSEAASGRSSRFSAFTLSSPKVHTILMEDGKTWGFTEQPSIRRGETLELDPTFDPESPAYAPPAFGSPSLNLLNRPMKRRTASFDLNDGEVGPKTEHGSSNADVFGPTDLLFPPVPSPESFLAPDLDWDRSLEFDLDHPEGSFFTPKAQPDGVLRYRPIGPIRVDFGIPVQSDEFNDSAGKFNRILIAK